MELLKEFTNSYICSYLQINENDCYYNNDMIVITREGKFTKVETIKIEDWLDSRPHISSYEILENKITIWL